MINAITIKMIFGAALIMGSLAIAGTPADSRRLPAIQILATGGSIAGSSSPESPVIYVAGTIAVEELIRASPEIHKIARVSGEQVANTDSQNMNDDIWLKLGKRVNEVLAQQDIDGVVITHGTDTLEETAYFLHLTVKSHKPVVLVGAWLPSNFISPDGPGNLYNAIAVAADRASPGRGVLVTMNNTIFDARDITKNPVTTDRFFAPHFGALGYIRNDKVNYQRQPERKHTLDTEFELDPIDTLPKVGIVYGHANASELPVTAYINEGFDGIVSAGTGNGNLYHRVLEALVQARQQGILVVRSARIAAGITNLNVEIDDHHHEFVASGTLNPQKSRILLMLALTRTRNYQEIQAMFDRY